MLLNEKEKIIFLQNPKTGGRFKVNNRKNKDFLDDGIIGYNDKYPPLNKLFPFHTTFSDIQKFYKDDLKKWKVYTMIRNPYNHFISVCNSNELLNSPIYTYKNIKKWRPKLYIRYTRDS